MLLYTLGHLGNLLCCCIHWNTWDTCCCVVVYFGTPGTTCCVVVYIGTPAAVLLYTLEHLLLCCCIHWNTCCVVVYIGTTAAVLLYTLEHLLLYCCIHWNTCCCVHCEFREPVLVRLRLKKLNFNTKGPLQSKILAFSVTASIFAVYVLSKRRAIYIYIRCIYIIIILSKENCQNNGSYLTFILGMCPSCTGNLPS